MDDVKIRKKNKILSPKGAILWPWTAQNHYSNHSRGQTSTISMISITKIKDSTLSKTILTSLTSTLRI